MVLSSIGVPALPALSNPTYRPLFPLEVPDRD
jgi:hypothetical protein